MSNSERSQLGQSSDLRHLRGKALKAKGRCGRLELLNQDSKCIGALGLSFVIWRFYYFFNCNLMWACIEDPGGIKAGDLNFFQVQKKAHYQPQRNACGCCCDNACTLDDGR